MSHRIGEGVLALAAIALVAGCAGSRPVPPTEAADACDGWSGAWEGTFPVRSNDPGKDEVKDELTVRLLFGRGVPQVFSVEQGRWIEAKPESFVARCVGPNAVLHAIDTDGDTDGRWYESWVFVVTRRTDRELLARWVRMVNNVATPIEKPSSKFSFEGVGVLHRVQLPTVATQCDPNTSDTLGPYLDSACRCGAARACELLALLEERANAAERASQLRTRACDLGRPTACPGPP